MSSCFAVLESLALEFELCVSRSVDSFENVSELVAKAAELLKCSVAAIVEAVGAFGESPSALVNGKCSKVDHVAVEESSLKVATALHNARQHLCRGFKANVRPGAFPKPFVIEDFVPELAAGPNIALDIGGTLLKIVYKVPLAKLKHRNTFFYFYGAYHESLDISRLLETHAGVKIVDSVPISENVVSALGQAKRYYQSVQFNKDYALCFRYFTATDLEKAVEFIKAESLVPSNKVLSVTGGGAMKFAPKLVELLNLDKVDKQPEVESVDLGLRIMHRVNNFALELRVDTGVNSPQNGQTTQVIEGVQYPYIVVNIGSGISILKVTGPGQCTRVSGTSLGGGTAHGLCKYLLDLESFHQYMSLYTNGTVQMIKGNDASSGSNELDLLEFTGETSEVVGNLHENTISPHMCMQVSFGRLREDAGDAAITRSITDMISWNIGCLSLLVARLCSTSRIFFTGKYTFSYRITVDTIIAAIAHMSRFYPGPPIEAFMPLHAGYLGALGSMWGCMHQKQ